MPVDFDAYVSNTGIEFVLRNIYLYEVDKNLVNMSELSFSEFFQLHTNCEKYLANLINIEDIIIDDNANVIKVNAYLGEYLTKAATDFCRFVVAYLAKQGIKSSACQTGNESTVII